MYNTLNLELNYFYDRDILARAQWSFVDPTKISQPGIMRKIRNWGGTALLVLGLLAGCGGNEVVNATVESQTPTPSATAQPSDEKKYGCVGTIRTLSLNDPDTGELLTRMDDHTRVRINGTVTEEQDKTLDNSARNKENNPNADYNWVDITFVDKNGVIWNGAAASNWIDPVNPVDGGCNHMPGQNVHNGYGSEYEGR